MNAAPVSVIIPTWRRRERLLATLHEISQCDPQPAEILVHVDAGDDESAPAVAKEFPQIHVIASTASRGPGGGRNLLLDAAKSPIIASLDDDSFPMDRDFFAQAVELFERHPRVVAISCAVFHDGETIEPVRTDADHLVADFINCAALYRREKFTPRFLALPLAYGMEEVDAALQLHAAGGDILETKRLRVRHATQLNHHARPDVSAASLANIALLAALRYPLSQAWIGVGQYASRALWLLRNGRWRGVPLGFARTFQLIWKYRQHRAPVSPEALRGFLSRRRNPVPVTS